MSFLSAAHKSVIDVRDDLALLIAQRRTNHHEHHRTGAAGLVVNLLDRGAQRDLIAGPNRRDEFHILAGVETLPSKARHLLEKMPPVAKRGRESRRRDDAAIGSLLRRFVIGEDRIGLADGLAEFGDLLA